MTAVPPRRVLLIEDEPGLVLTLGDRLRAEGFDAAFASDGPGGLERATRERWDVILLDVMLPHRDGFEVCRELRGARIKTPIIMLTAKTQEAEKILGLEFGADDYVTKPFSANELRARIKAVRRRFEEATGGAYRFGDCEVDFERADLKRDGRRVDVTALEFRLLQALVRSRGRVLTREQLIQHAWEPNTYIGDRVVDTHVLNLRKKIEPDPARPRYLISVRGIGYRFDG